MELSEIRENFRGPYAAEYVSLDDLTASEREHLPSSWSAAIGSPDEEIGPLMASRWREVCPTMPRLARYLERHLLHVGLARIKRPYHYVRQMQDGPQPESERTMTEVALVYLIADPDGSRPFYSWLGRRPYDGPQPAWWKSLEAVIGTLAVDLHDGFMHEFGESGIVAVSDMHSVYRRWIQNIDDNLVQMNVTVSPTDYTPIDRNQWPDFGSLMVIAEESTMMAWAVDPAKPDGSGWGGSYDMLHPFTDLAHQIETMIGTVIGAVQNDTFKGPLDDAGRRDPQFPGARRRADPSRRLRVADRPAPIAATAIVVSSVGFFTGPRGDDVDTAIAHSVQINKVTELDPPKGFAKIVASSSAISAATFAAQPLPPGFSVHPSECAPAATTVGAKDLNAIKTVMFRSTSTVVIALAFDAKTPEGFGPRERCRTVSISGPGGAGGFFVPADPPPVAGADAAWGTHALLNDGDGTGTYDQYLYFAKVKDNYRVMVTVAPNYRQEELPPHVDPQIGIGVLQQAVAAMGGV